jgi:hypothetical protein
MKLNAKLKRIAFILAKATNFDGAEKTSRLGKSNSRSAN